MQFFLTQDSSAVATLYLPVTSLLILEGLIVLCSCQVFSFCVTCMPALEPSCGIGPPTFGAISQKALDFWGLSQPLLQRLTIFAFRVQILAICSKDYFWTLGESGLS